MSAALRQTFTKPAYSLPELVALLPIGRSFIYLQMKAGLLTGRKIGRRTIFLVDEIIEWLSVAPIAQYMESKQ